MPTEPHEPPPDIVSDHGELSFVYRDTDIPVPPSHWEHAPTLIGLGGYLRAGKDALADFLVTRHGFTKLGMSDVLAHALYALNPFIPHVSFPDQRAPMRYSVHVDAVGYTRAKQHPEVRRLLQTLGTEVGRNILGPDIWVDAIGKKIRELRSTGHPVVLTGVRFPNELAMVAMHGGHTVWVARDGTAPADHTSESTLTAKDFEWEVYNHGTLDDLALQVDALVARFTP